MRILLALIFLLFAGACQRPPAPLEHEAYVWQRQWQPALVQALNESAGHVQAWRVLAAEIDDGGKNFRPAVDFPALMATGRPVIAVIRIQPRVESANASALVAEILAIAKAWRQASVPLSGVEIDHDATLRNLPDHVNFLRTLRAALDRDLRLSATLLPSWLEAPALLADLTASVDETVLQLHSLQANAALFEPAIAKSRVEAFARLSRSPFRIALPNYGSRVSVGLRGRIEAVESEGRADSGAGDADRLERYAPPEAIAGFIARLRQHRPAGLRGIVWFRLPTANDKRCWSLTTWHAVIDGTPLTVKLAAELQAAPGQWRMLTLRNAGAIDAELPAELRIEAVCRLPAQAVGPYVAETQTAATLWLRSQRRLLRAGETLEVGQARCPVSVGRVDIRP